MKHDPITRDDACGCPACSFSFAPPRSARAELAAELPLLLAAAGLTLAVVAVIAAVRNWPAIAAAAGGLL